MTEAAAHISERHDYERLARRAKLRYVSDIEAGFTRKRCGRGFTYQDGNGKTVTCKKLRARFEALIIPPMWSEVWICRDDKGHLQATGRDDKGRKQYLYHPKWDNVRDHAKFSAMIDFANALPKLRSQVEKDLAAPELSRENVLAAVIKLLETTLIRVGNSRYAKLNKSFGLTTLRSRHVSETEDGLAFDFVGKSAKSHHIELHDERLIAIIQACSELSGYRIFKYLDENGNKQVVDSGTINAYLRKHCGDCDDFSAKDFRTWMASVLAASYLYDELSGEQKEVLNTPPDSKARQKLVTVMVKNVAAELGNTPTVCRASYIHPKIIERFLAGTFFDDYKNARRGRTRAHQSIEEKALLAFLSS